MTNSTQDFDFSTKPTDIDGIPYAKLSQLKPGNKVIPDGDFDCLLAWQPLTVVDFEGELSVIHNTETCGACGGENEICPHGLDGQLQDDGDTLIGIYHEEDYNKHK